MVKSLSRVQLLQPSGLKPTRLLHPWDSPGKNTGVDCHFLLQGIFPTQGSNQVSRIGGRRFNLWTTREDECNCVVVWALFGIAFLWDWNENWPFPVLWSLLGFPNLLAYWLQHFQSIIFQDLKQLNWNSIASIALFVVMLSKAHLTSHSRMSGSRWVITPSWLCWSWRYFCTVLLCIVAISSQYLLLLLGPYNFCPLLSPFLHEMFHW